jgi:predicted alpha/beta-hydrolase family hydrolase
VVLFVHGSGSSRHSPRNRFVAETLNEAGLATLLFDLLTPAEESVDIYTRQPPQSRKRKRLSRSCLKRRAPLWEKKARKPPESPHTR